MVKAVLVSVVALVMSVGVFSVAQAQTTTTPSPTVTTTPSPTTTVPGGAPATGFGGN